MALRQRRRPQVSAGSLPIKISSRVLSRRLWLKRLHRKTFLLVPVIRRKTPLLLANCELPAVGNVCSWRQPSSGDVSGGETASTGWGNNSVVNSQKSKTRTKQRVLSFGEISRIWRRSR